VDDLLLPSNGRRGVEILHGTVQTYFWHASRKNPYEFTSLGGALLRNKSSQAVGSQKKARAKIHTRSARPPSALCSRTLTTSKDQPYRDYTNDKPKSTGGAVAGRNNRDQNWGVKLPDRPPHVAARTHHAAPCTRLQCTDTPRRQATQQSALQPT
jgi:hypothetical protein